MCRVRTLLATRLLILDLPVGFAALGKSTMSLVWERKDGIARD